MTDQVRLNEIVTNVMKRLNLIGEISAFSGKQEIGSYSL